MTMESHNHMNRGLCKARSCTLVAWGTGESKKMNRAKSVVNKMFCIGPERLSLATILSSTAPWGFEINPKAIIKALCMAVVFLAANLFAASAAQAQTNVALNKTITGFSSQVDGTTWAATNINDGVVNLTDRAWASVNQAPNSTGLDEWVSIDLGAAYLLDSLRVTSEIVTGGSRNIKDYNLYGSATGDFAGEETLLSSGTIPPLGDMGTHDVSFTPQAFRYVKLQGTSTYFIGSNIYVIVGELALFGELVPDSDGDGVFDDVDIDDDNDGILDTVEGDGAVDTDGDGLADSLDLDSDGDGLPDTTEAQAGTITASGNDTDNDGLDDNFEPGGLPATAQDADGDSTPDWRDLNVAQLVIEKVGTARTTSSTSAVAEDDLIDWVLSYDNQTGGTINNVVLGDVLSGDHSVVSSDFPDGWGFTAGEFTADRVAGGGFGLTTPLPAVPAATNINFGSTGGDGYDPILGADDGRIYMTFHHQSSNGVLQCVDPVTGTVCAGYTVLLRPNLISSTKIGQTPENTLFIGNRLYYPYTDPTSSDWGLGCFDVSAYDGVDPLTGNCDKDSNFSGSAWDDGGVSLGGGGVTSDRGAIQGPVLADDGNLYLFDYNMLMHCVQPDGNLCATTGTNMSTGDANLFTISADSLYSGTAIEMELWQNRIYFGVMYHDVTDGGDPNNSSVVIGCFDIATATNCWGTSAIVDDLSGLSIDASTFSNIHIRYDQAGAADAVCILSRAYDSTRNAEGCASLTGVAIANDDATYCAAYPGGTCVRGIPTNLEALFPNVNRTNGSGGEVHHNGRTYFNRFFTDEVYCWDWLAAPGGALCADFGVAGLVTGPTGAETYGIARDEAGCFWVLGDNNNLWNFDVLGNSPCLIGEIFADETLTPANTYCATGPSALTDNGALWEKLRLTDIDSDQFIALSADVYDLTGALVTHCDFKADTCSNGFTVVDSGFEETVDLSSLSVAGNNLELRVEFAAQVPLGTDLEALGRSPQFDLTWDYPGTAPPLELCLVTDPGPTSCPVSGSDFAANSATVQLQGSPNPDDSAGPVSLDIIPSTTAATCSMDYGDAPDSYGALLASDGARHALQTGTLARYVRIMKSGNNTFDDLINLAEVEVLDAGGVNRALASMGATASQNSTFNSSTLALNCNDGNTTGSGGASNICATAGTTANDWWEVDLGAVYNIAEINIFNRDDGAEERLSNVYVLAADTAFPGTTNLTDARNNADFEFQLGEVIAANPDRTVTVTGGTAPTLTLGPTVDNEADGQPSGTATDDGADEDGSVFRSPAGTSHSIFGDVTVNNATGGSVTVCAWLDLPSGGSVDGAFGASDGQCQTTSASNPTLTFQWSGLPDDQTYATYARFRVSSSAMTTSQATGAFADGEIEDYLVNFDFTPTRATVKGLRARLLPAGSLREVAGLASLVEGIADSQLVAVVEWETVMEQGTSGFDLERRGENGSWQKLNNQMLPGLVVSRQGGEYLWVDTEVSEGKVSYRLVEHEVWGTELMHGPWKVDLKAPLPGKGRGPSKSMQPSISEGGSSNGVLEWWAWEKLDRRFAGRGRSAPLPDEEEVATRLRQRTAQRQIQLKQRAGAAALADKSASTVGSGGRQAGLGAGVGSRDGNNLIKSRPKGSARLVTDGSGWYSAQVADLAAALGAPSAKVSALLRKSHLGLSMGGQEVPYSYDGGSTIYLVGYPYQNLDTFSNAYQLGRSRGTAMAVTSGSGPSSGVAGTFRDTLVAEQEVWLLPWATREEGGDTWYWDFTYAPYTPETVLSFDLPDAAAAGTADLRIALRGASKNGSAQDHHAWVSVNGQVLPGSVTWDAYGLVTLETSFDQSLLAGGNTVTLTVHAQAGGDATYSLVLVDDVQVSFERKMRAKEGSLWVRNASTGVMTVEGFESADIRVIELSQGTSATERQNLTVGADGLGGWQVSFRGKNGRDYLVVDRARPALVEAEVASSLKNRGLSAEYLIIAPESLAEGAQALKDYRSNRFSTQIVWLQDIYDEFSYGRTDSAAIEAFLASVYAKSPQPPLYVVLLGRGTLDHRDLQGYGESLIPLRLAVTPWGLYSSDNRYADINGDKRPEFSVGRIQAMTNAEVLTYVNKLAAYEAGVGTGSALVLADNPDAAGDFHANSEKTAANLRSYGVTVDKLYHPTDAVRTDLLSGWAAGDWSLIVYDGHGASTQLGSEAYLKSSDVAGLTNGSALPVFSAWTCAAGDSTSPGIMGLADSLVLSSGGGAIAAVAPAGLSLDAPAQRLSQSFLNSLVGRGETVGQAFVRAHEQGEAEGLSPWMLDIYLVSGDPAVNLQD